MTPYQTLNVAENASDAEIKQAYLSKAKESPPDANPDQFRLIHEAYLSIKDHKSRVSYALFTLPEINFDTLTNRALQTDKNKPLTHDLFMQFLNTTVDETLQKIEK